MQYHMEHVEPLRRPVELEMLPHRPQPLLQLSILFFRYRHQNLLHPQHLRNLHRHRKRLPPEDITERQDVALRQDHGDALSVNGLHDAWTGHLMAARAEAEL